MSRIRMAVSQGRGQLWRTGLVLVMALAAGVAACGGGSSVPGPPPSSLGVVQNRPIPDIPLVDERGQPTSLAAYRGRVVVLASFLTLCQETCPLTTGAFLSMHRAVTTAGLDNRVVFIEATVDPDRDSSARLAAYTQLSGARWPLLTGTPENLASLWKFFGAYYEKTPVATPPGIDWLTHQPLTYDVSHSDGFFLIDARGHERFATIATPDVGGQLKPALSNLLGEQGHRDLSHPGTPSWTPSQGLQAIGWLVGRNIAPASS